MRSLALCSTLCVLLSLALPASAAGRSRPAASRPEAVAAIRKLEVEPKTVRLTGRGSATRFVVTAHRSDGTVGDVSRAAKPELSGKAVALLPDGRVTARADGRATV